jgi:ubiquinone/menaquinone biosynthesis C-methylase UbiE
MKMSNLEDQQYLLNEEYKSASRLKIRLQLLQRFSTNGIDYYRWIFDHFDLKPNSRILELGCGLGTLWQKNLDRIPADSIIILSDFSPGMLQEAQRNLHDSSPSFTFQIVDAQSIPFETAHFDTVIANNMLYHIPDRQRAFSEIHRILKLDGRFYASTFGQASFSAMGRLITHTNTNLWAEPLGFSIENGAEQLSPWFTHVDLYPLEDTLAVTEAEPLLQMVRIGIGGSQPDEKQFQQVQEEVKRELMQHGVIQVEVQFGLFVAYGLK